MEVVLCFRHSAAQLLTYMYDYNLITLEGGTLHYWCPEPRQPVNFWLNGFV